MSWRRREPVIDAETWNDLVRFLMRMDAKLDRLLHALEEDDAEG